MKSMKSIKNNKTFIIIAFIVFILAICIILYLCFIKQYKINFVDVPEPTDETESEDVPQTTIGTDGKIREPVTTKFDTVSAVNKEIYGKAGSLRYRGLKPKVRGVAMNPVDHPHGGRTKTNKPEVSP